MKVIILDTVSHTAVDMINAEEDMSVDVKTDLSEKEIMKIIDQYDAIIVRGTKITKNIIEKASKLKLIGRAGVGYDNIDIDAATRKGIAVMNTPFGNVNSAAEHTVAMILTLSRNIHKADIFMKHEKKWDKKRFMGIELKGKTLGIIGLGKVGKIVAGICNGLHMNVIACDPFIEADYMRHLNVKKVELNELLKESDFVSLHVHLIESTKNIIDKEQIAMMKDGVRIINAGRGGLINEDALYDAIKSKKVNSAAIDVWINEPFVESRLMDMDEVLATPHIGATTIEAQENVAIDVAHEIIDGLKKGILVNVVNETESQDLFEKTTDGKLASPKLRAGLKNYVIDIDGVLCEDVPNEEQDRMKTAAEIPGAKDRVNKWYEQGHIITFFTSRTEDMKKITEKWLAKHEFKYHYVLFNKPRGGNYHYIDDRSIKATKFDGDFNNI